MKEILEMKRRHERYLKKKLQAQTTIHSTTNGHKVV